MFTQVQGAVIKEIRPAVDHSFTAVALVLVVVAVGDAVTEERFLDAAREPVHWAQEEALLAAHADAVELVRLVRALEHAVAELVLRHTV